MLTLKDIRKSYPSGDGMLEVLKGINISFRKNEFTSILGTSGSGKTTLLNIIGGLDHYDSGDLVIDGISTKNYREKDWDAYRNRRVGFIFQSYNLIMHQSVLANVEIAMTLSGVGRGERRRRAVKALQDVGLGDQIHKKPSQLSGGQMQRVAIARALVNNPEIILADEPTGALDSVTSIQIMDLLKEIAKDRLIIMVTHNPDIARQYSTRIIELKDGQIISDTDPYDNVSNTERTEPVQRTSMSLMTSLALSARNLMTKRGRTFLTAFAGSIGIIGIALILSLTSGVKYYADEFERDAMSDFPITAERTSLDLGSVLDTITSAQTPAPCPEGKACSVDDVVSPAVHSGGSLIRTNDLKSFKQFLDNSSEMQPLCDEISYSYDLNLLVYTEDGRRVNPSPYVTDDSLFTELPAGKNRLDRSYEVLAGTMPQAENEIALIVSSDSRISDSLLYSLGIKDASQIEKDMEAIRRDETYQVASKEYTYESFLNRTYRLVLNTAVYSEENGIFTDRSHDDAYMLPLIAQGMELKITGVLKDTSGASSKIGYLPSLTKHLIAELSKTPLYQAQIKDKTVNAVTKEPFDGIFNTYEAAAKELGIADESDPSSVSIYPKDYESKQKVTALIDAYNQGLKDAGKEDQMISVSDMMKTMLGGITGTVSVVSYVLIALVAVSLIVSSIMIAIITYISVLERTREIGILRAVGASKKDIVGVFRAETVIEGLFAGTMGVLIAWVLNQLINVIAKAVSQIDGIARLPLPAAVILILLSVVLNVIAGSIPSRIAAKKDPVEALRAE